MSAEEFSFRYYFARWSILVLLVMTIYSQSASAQLFFTSPFIDEDHPSNIAFSAPDSIQDLLEDHVERPDAPLADKTSQHIFIRRAKREINEILATEGYFTPTVTLNRTHSEDLEHLEIVVKPGPQARVGEITITFQGEILADEKKHRKRIKKLRKAWLLKSGDAFRSQDWEEAKAQLLSDIRHKDYASAKIIDSQATVDPDTKQVQLSITFDSGPVFYFGDIIVTGLDRYHQTEIQNFAPFKPGDPYRRELLFYFQNTLQKIPHFSAVSVTVDSDRSQHKAAPIHIQLTEKKSKRIALGAGYSSNNGGRG
jgi:translocation and assembly module TamA